MIYAMQPVRGGPIKLGFTSNVAQRKRAFENAHKVKMNLLWSADGDEHAERELLARFAHLRLGREEQFRPALELIEFLGSPPKAIPETVRRGNKAIKHASGAAAPIDRDLMRMAKWLASVQEPRVTVGQYLTMILAPVVDEKYKAALAPQES